MDGIVALRAGGVSLLVAAEEGRGLPRVLHWGADAGPVTADDAAALLAADRWGLPDRAPDMGALVGIVPEARFFWSGTPGLIGSRDGADWSPEWRVAQILVDGEPLAGGFHEAGAGVVEFLAEAAGLSLALVVELLPTGLARSRATLTNTADAPFRVDELTVRFPVPTSAHEVLDFGGRWAQERVPQRSTLGVGAHRREGRSGRTGAHSAYILSIGQDGFGYDTGEIWAAHTAWSGNHIHIAERDYLGAQVVGGGELLLPGEGTLACGRSYATPWVYFNYSVGLDAQAARFHAHLRTLPAHPSSPRPVTLNVWEAVYFDHDADRLVDLAERAAALGVERVVLDDGWFGARRDDTAGLGDWVVSPDVWPTGLHPFVDRVKDLGMEFGLWFEPEMVNVDSDVARAHPEWIMQPGGRLPLEWRQQQVLNLAIPGAYEHVLGQMSAIFEEYRIDYVKWDHNRDLVEAGTAPEGRPAVAAQTRAYYRLLDELRRRFPHIEFESCSSGGARIDLEVMERVQRVWVSDNSDPEDRQRMLWWTGQLLPLEVMGSHVASGRSHVTGRTHDLDFRAATAVFGHFGIEWDLKEATAEELRRLGWWIDWYKAHRDTLHAGRLVRVDLGHPAVFFKGVVTPERAVFSLAVLRTPSEVSLGRLRLPGLDPAARYRVTVVDPRSADGTAQGVIATGAQLATVGVRAPQLQPCTAALFEAERISG
ncbi:MAG: alpha-galactosidase [Arachnia sp.]